MFIGNIGVETDFGFRRMGCVHYFEDNHVAQVNLQAYTFNDCVSRTRLDTPPYLEGDIYSAWEGDRIYFGNINTSDKEDGVIYFFRWWAIPIVGIVDNERGHWFNIELKDV